MAGGDRVEKLFEVPAETARPDVRSLVALYVRGHQERVHKRPPERVVGQVAKQCAKLTAEGVDELILAGAIETMLDKALSPTLLPQLAAQEELRVSQSRERAYVDRHGWPTGWHWVRGEGAGTHIRDTLGHDKRPHWEPYTPRPTLDEIEEALREREASEGS